MTEDNRTIIGAYSELVVRQLVGKLRRYKSDSKYKQTNSHQKAGVAIARNCLSVRRKSAYGFDMTFPENDVGAVIDDLSGDKLDAILCAVQAAWALFVKTACLGR